MTLQLVGHDFAYETECLLRLFYPGERIAVVKGAGEISGDLVLTEMIVEDKGIFLRAAIRMGDKLLGEEKRIPEPFSLPRDAELALCGLLFFCLCELTGTRPPWGILTGVRPLRLMRKLTQERHITLEKARDLFESDYHTLPDRAELAMRTLKAQGGIPDSVSPESYSLYVNIPFCPSRCLYCSFVTHAVDRARRLLGEYLELLCRELEIIGELVSEKGLFLETIYIGGGTPTVLSALELDKLLYCIEKNFQVHRAREYTVEAGRPDSITAEKLNAMRGRGVDRVSVNPQTMNDSVLRAIGREHTAHDTGDAYILARKAGFSSINMDLIAGLPGDTPESFADTIAKAVSMRPDNLTVHTLTVKRSSSLRLREDAFAESPFDIGEMLRASREALFEAGYSPYYLYRQQGTRQNHENTGYTLPGRVGVYNILSMEDACTILAAGAGGVTKLCRSPREIKRVFNYKYPYEYIRGFDALMARKNEIREFFKKT
jgi:oxygen-independent coproporphyrinogen-3 oxidase